MLEPCDGKLSRTVLRGEGSRKAPALPGQKNSGKDISISSKRRMRKKSYVSMAELPSLLTKNVSIHY